MLMDRRYPNLFGRQGRNGKTSLCVLNPCARNRASRILQDHYIILGVPPSQPSPCTAINPSLVYQFFNRFARQYYLYRLRKGKTLHSPLLFDLTGSVIDEGILKSFASKRPLFTPNPPKKKRDQVDSKAESKAERKAKRKAERKAEKKAQKKAERKAEREAERAKAGAEMPSSCKDIRDALAQCLQSSDCVMIQRNSPSDCLRSPLLETMPTKCQQLKKGYGECKRGMVDMRKRFRGNQPIAVSKELEGGASDRSSGQLYAGRSLGDVKATSGNEPVERDWREVENERFRREGK